MSEIKDGQFYVYRDEDGNAVAIAVMTKGPNGGRIGIDYARMPVPYGKTTREDINNRAEFMVAAMNSYGGHSAALAAKDAEIKLLREAMHTDFCVLFLDGRNEHGSHVLASYPRSFDVVDDDISEQAEAILVAAENEGFQVGQHVWAEFNWVEPQRGDEGRVELSGYWDFRQINVELTRAALKEQANG